MKTVSLPPATTSDQQDSTFALWLRLAGFPANETDAALRYLQEWIAQTIDADNVIWIGAVRAVHGTEAQQDPMLGWRLRIRQPLRPDPEAYQKKLAGLANIDGQRFTLSLVSLLPDNSAGLLGAFTRALALIRRRRRAA